MYKILNQTQKHFTASVYRSLAANAVTQHQFREAKYYLDSAAQIGDKLAFTILQQSEVQLELGNLPEAKRLLKLYPQQQSFEALIRLAKIRDQEGKLEEAIELLELAQSKITPENDEESYIWLKSNLGDFYSHNGQLRKAYQCYLTVLQIEPENYHCLKGIAWLAFSHDKKTAEAKEILEFLKSQHPVPDYDLMLGEIASFENDDNASRNYEEKFAMAVAKKEYGFMYNKYLFSLYADEWNDLDKAFLIAKTEVDNRPTAESYSLLSWANFKKGNYNEALRIAKKYVEGKCFEPEVAYYLGVIYKKTGDYFKASKYFKEVKSSIFELGPSYISKLKS